MREVLADVVRWRKENTDPERTPSRRPFGSAGKPVALATVIKTWGSSPRGIGAKMAFTPNGEISGSVSGGCVENAVFEAGIDALKNKRSKLLHFGVSNESAWNVGLACGGSIDIFVQPLDWEMFQTLENILKKDKKAVLATLVRGPAEILGREILLDEDGRRIAGSIDKSLDGSIAILAKEVLARGGSQSFEINPDVDVFIEAILPPPTLVVVGGVHIAIALMALAKTMGYRTMLIDPRKAWGNAERFPNVDQLIQAWPDEAFEQITVNDSTAIVMLTHDPKLDDLALKIALPSPAFYVGALGSKTTQAARHKSLLETGLSEAQLSRLHGPIGLDIGAKTPEEIALAIMAEIVDVYRKQGQHVLVQQSIKA
jgi:xanthine dehydrogenase accessory factor